jgi:hypothetical protein
MKKHLSLLFILSFFCIVLPFRYSGILTTAPQTLAEAKVEAEDEADDDEADDETEDETPPDSRNAFTVERGTLAMPDGVRLAVSYWMPKAKNRERDSRPSSR